MANIREVASGWYSKAYAKLRDEHDVKIAKDAKLGCEYECTQRAEKLASKFDEEDFESVWVVVFEKDGDLYVAAPEQTGGDVRECDVNNSEQIESYVQEGENIVVFGAGKASYYAE